MANVFETNDVVVATAARLYDKNVVANALKTGYVEDSEFGNANGGAVRIRIPGTTTAGDVTGGSYVAGEVQETNVPVGVRKFATAKVPLTHNNTSFDLQQLGTQVLDGMVQPLAEQVNRYVYTKAIEEVYDWVGVPGADPSTVADFMRPKKPLFRNKATGLRRMGLLGNDHGFAMASLTQLTNANQAGSTTMLREGSQRTGYITRIAGTDFWEDQAVDAVGIHQVGDYDNGTVLTNGAAIATATSISLDGGEAVGTVNAGDRFTIAGANWPDGSPRQFRVTTQETAAAGAVTIAFLPALGVNVADNTAVTFLGDQGGTVKLSLVADEGFMAVNVFPVTNGFSEARWPLEERTVYDPVLGFGMTFRMFAQSELDGSKSFLFECWVASKVVRPQLACLLVS